MPLQPGTTLGPYEILSPIGAGGMGEVYKATDTRLDRTVAIKVLPEHVASDHDLQQRFEREAKTIGHPRHQGWYRWPIVFDLLLADRPAESMAELELIDQPRVWRMVWECILHSVLGNAEETAAAKERLMQAYPHYTYTWGQGVMHYHPTLSERVRVFHLQAGLPMG